MRYERLTAEYNAALAALIRKSLKAHRLDIPGTVYFDAGLDDLSSYYDRPGRAYFVLLEDERLAGGIGLAEIGVFPACCELQKLYLDEAFQGHGLGYGMIDRIESEAKKLGYHRVYLETHTNLQAAIHIYEKSGYRQIARPDGVVHGTMNRFYLKTL
ncbi:MAG: GNAT family N-acetyltransferase [Clostridia bacterium]|nr:GNAT family N-acetyltransferase [Clostridia bacterium]